VVEVFVVAVILRARKAEEPRVVAVEGGQDGSERPCEAFLERLGAPTFHDRLLTARTNDGGIDKEKSFVMSAML
jgi:hypothetical protein